MGKTPKIQPGEAAWSPVSKRTRSRDPLHAFGTGWERIRKAGKYLFTHYCSFLWLSFLLSPSLSTNLVCGFTDEWRAHHGKTEQVTL